MTDLDEIDRLRQENAALRRQVANHPALTTLRFLAPFIRAAIDKGTWANTDLVTHELAAGLALGDRMVANVPVQEALL